MGRILTIESPTDYLSKGKNFTCNVFTISTHFSVGLSTVRVRSLGVNRCLKLPDNDAAGHIDTLVDLGGAILPSQVDLDRLMAKKYRMGADAPKVRVVVGKNYGKNADGSSKPMRAMIEERVEILNFEMISKFCKIFY